MTHTAARERLSRQEDEGSGERVCRLEVGGEDVGGKAWAGARVLITTSRSEKRRPGVGRVALDGEAVLGGAEGRAEWRSWRVGLAVERHLGSGDASAASCSRVMRRAPLNRVALNGVVGGKCHGALAEA